jgi:hypothetical protein
MLKTSIQKFEEAMAFTTDLGDRMAIFLGRIAQKKKSPLPQSFARIISKSDVVRPGPTKVPEEDNEVTPRS